MTRVRRTKNHGGCGKIIRLFATLLVGMCPLLKADVVNRQNGVVLTGKILQQLGSGTCRYPSAAIKELKRGPRLADTGWAPAIQQVPAMVITCGNFKNVPYISF